jgi:hypothetical protein
VNLLENTRKKEYKSILLNKDWENLWDIIGDELFISLFTYFSVSV